MNLYLRLLAMFLSVRWKGAVPPLAEFRSSHLVWPNDLDLLGHMNNGRYFTITDPVRIEMLIRAGVWAVLRRQGLHPVLAGETIQFRRALKPFQRYELRTRTLGWDEKFFYVEHRFMRGETVHALALVKVRLVGAGRPKPIDILRQVDPTAPEVNMVGVIEKWNASSDEHWAELHAA
tara:strand:+ start:202 stop:732 length:531 start_codon:yes stop_codon:yes gene_type:complete